MATASSNTAESTHDAEEHKERFHRRYITSVAGLAHAVLSLTSLGSSLVLFVYHCVGNLDYTWTSSVAMDRLATVCFVSTFLGSSVTALVFWDQVPNWQLATTSLKEKGLTPMDMKLMNQGRGIVALLLSSSYPLLLRFGPLGILSSRSFSVGVALLLLVTARAVFALIRRYEVNSFLFLGAYSTGIAISILADVCLNEGGSIASLHKEFPFFQNHLEMEAAFLIACVQYGFLWYFCYSRRLVSKEQVQRNCKLFHIPVSVAFAVRRGVLDVGIALLRRRWIVTPWPLCIFPLSLYPLLILSFAIRSIRKIAAQATSSSQQTKSKTLLVIE